MAIANFLSTRRKLHFSWSKIILLLCFTLFSSAHSMRRFGQYVSAQKKQPIFPNLRKVGKPLFVQDVSRFPDGIVTHNEQGAMGVVLMAPTDLAHKDPTQPIAIKYELPRHLAGTLQKVVGHLREETKIIEYLRDCPGCVRIAETLTGTKHISDAENNPVLVTNFHKGGSLMQYRNRNATQNFEMYANNFLIHLVPQVIVSLKEMHKREVFYRDMKLQNVVLDSDQKLTTVVDFDAAVKIEDFYKSSPRGEDLFRAPEAALAALLVENKVHPVIATKHITNPAACDWWTVGLMILDGLHILRGGKIQDNMNLFREETLRPGGHPYPEYFLPGPSQDKLADAVKDLIDVDPDKRSPEAFLSWASSMSDQYK